MRKKININDFIEYFREQKSFTAIEISLYFKEIKPGINKSAINWRIHTLVRRGIIQRTGRGLYTISGKSNFYPIPDRKQKKMAKQVGNQFPFINYCCWRLSSIREFHQHLPVIDFLIIEVEEDAMDAVFNFLKDSKKNTFKAPSKEIIEDIIIGADEPLIIKPLISQSPLIRINGTPIPTLEKILVDLYSEKDLFYFLQGNELLHIFRNANEKYAINIDKMLRYAGRRGKQAELRAILVQIKDNNKRDDFERLADR